MDPFSERAVAFGMSYGLSSCGYDVRSDQELILPAKGFALISTLERFIMPTDVVGRVHDKSTWARLGLAVQNTVIEPGWRGYLTLELSNNGYDIVEIKRGQPIAQIVFELLDEPTEAPYTGKYQDQEQRPVEAKWESV